METEQKKKLEVLMHSKNLVETSYNVTAVQNRIFYFCLFTAQKEKSGELCCTVKLEDIRKFIPNPNQRTLTNIKKMLRVLKDTSLIFDQEDDGDLIECDYNLIAGSEYNTNKQEFKIFFMERLYNHVLSYQNYAPLNLEILSRYTSFYSQRLYEVLRMWSRTGQTIKHTFKIDKLRFILGVGDKYPEYKNLKQRALTQALKEINAVGNMEVEIEEIKEGKKVTKLEFTIYDKEPKTYFKERRNDPQQRIKAVNAEMAIDADKIAEYINYPDTDFLSPKIKTLFMQYCYEAHHYFDDCTERFFNEAKEIVRYRKGIDRITKINDYKYFLGIFKNKIEDDIRQFVALSCISN